MEPKIHNLPEDQHYTLTDKEHFKKSIRKGVTELNIGRLLAGYEALKIMDRGITRSVLINVALLGVVVPYLLSYVEMSYMTIVAQVLSALWGFGCIFNFLRWEEGINLIKAKRQAYAEIICEQEELIENRKEERRAHRSGRPT